MIKTIDIQVERQTWPNGAPPQAILNVTGKRNIDVTAFLLMIGYCTVPAHAARHSINALWAWVRYFGIVPATDFRLSEDFAELDPHQKTILSDDFGMGMSMHLLTNSLGFESFCDGKYFIERMSSRVRCRVAATNAKNGSHKSPDFVGWDSGGKFHVIECKGTQSGPDYNKKQLNDGVSQKNAIRFASPIRGESLVTGFVIARADKPSRSSFAIRDPEPEVPPLNIEADEVNLAAEALARGKIARGLMLAGAPNLSRIVAAPFGDDPAKLPEDELGAIAAERGYRLRSDGPEDIGGLTSSGSFLGREATFELPFRIETTGGSFTRALVRSEVAEEVVKFWIEKVRGAAPLEDRLDTDHENLAKGTISTETDGKGGELRDGSLFRTSIKFIK